MWSHMHLVEGDMETRVDVKARMGSRLHEAEQWRLAKELRWSKSSPGVLVEKLEGLIVRGRRWLGGTPQPQEQCC